MLSRLYAMLLLLCLGGLFSPANAGPLVLSELMAAPYAPDRVLVKFRPGSAAEDRSQAHRASGGRLLKTFDSIGVQLIQVPGGSVPAAVNVYTSNPNVIYAEPDYYRLLRVPSEEPEQTPAGGANFFTEQWYLNNTGQRYSYVTPQGRIGATRGTAGADINAPEAWDITIGQATVDPAARDTPKVAVLDSGADCNSLELQGKCLEQVNLVGLSVGYFDYCASSDPACDNYGHGTFVSSEVAANTDNEEGIAGIGWNTSLGIFKVCYQELVTDGINLFAVGLCPISSSITAIESASQDQFDSSGALLRSRYSVITMSYSSDFIDEGGNIFPTSPSDGECDAINAAWNNGVLVIAAAGNNGDTVRTYPAACTDGSGKSTVIAVAASDDNDDRTGFTTFSWPSDPWVSLSAPGKSIIGILPDAHCGLTPGTDSCVDWWDGTSMAAPLVAGGAALVWSSLFEHEGAAITAAGDCELLGMPCHQVVRDRLQNNAAILGVNGQDLRDWTRYGRLDVAAALTNTGNPEPPPPPSDYVLPTAGFSYLCVGFSCSFDAAASLGSQPLVYTWLLNGVVISTGQQYVDNFETSGTYTVTLQVSNTDLGGATQTSSATISLNLKRRNQTQSGNVSADGGDTGGSGNCPPKKQEKGQC